MSFARFSVSRRRLKALAYSTVSAAALVGVSISGAQAQDAPAASLDEIVVTGSRVVRDGYEAPTPVSVLGAEELNSLNAVNIADAVNVLPGFSGSVNPRTSNGNLSSGATGVSQLNLRGMGTNRTLILLDGHRYINSALTSGGSAPDINSFPNALIERVDVVTGGASAAYGSDALSGVVNFILDRDFTGIKGEVQAGMTKYRDDKNYSGQLTYGTPFANGRGHFLLSGEHTHNDGIKGTKGRPWAELPAAIIINPLYGTGAGQSTGNPQNVVRRDVGLSAGTPGGIITSGVLKGTYFGPGGVVTGGYNFGVNVGNNLQEGGDWRYSRIENGIDIAGMINRYVGYTRVSYDLTDTVTAYADAQWSNSHTVNVANPNRRLGNNTMSVDNAYLPASLRAALVAAGQTTFVMGSTHADMGRFIGDYRRTVRRVSGGFDGSFTAMETDWTWDAYIQHSQTGLSPRTYNNAWTPGYLKAIDSVMVNGAPVCRVNANASTTDDDPACVPYNMFGIGVNDAKALNYVLGVSYRYESLRQNVAAFSVNGEPFEMWAGPVSLAFGVEHRTESVKGIATDRDERTEYFAGNYKASTGKLNVTEGFVETVVPLARNESWAQELDLNAAVRATSYSTSGYVTTWKGGLTWRPIDDLRFRVTRSRDIRAPSLGELFTAGQTGSGGVVTDPFRLVNGQPESRPNNFTLTRGNPALLPEKADTTGIGVVMAPTFLPGFQASVDYYRIDVKGTVQSPSAQTVIDLCFQGNTVLCQAVLRNPVVAGDPISSTLGQIFMVVTQPENLIGQKAAGIDFEASYRFQLADLVESWGGEIAIRAMGSRVLTLDTQNTDGKVYDGVGVVGGWAGIPPFSGNLNAPKFRGNVSVAYNGDPITMRLTVRHTAAGVYGNGFIECRSGCPVSTSAAPTIEDNHIAGMTTFDLAGTYKPLEDQNIELFATIENLTNAQPPIIGGSRSSTHWSGQANADYDRVGRQYRLGMRFQF
ncbi:MAG: TonB-dependent receptor [Rhodospirillaceae bacterium]|nr:TonB-dependent receptor [Rhodospirillaceae bacterium]